MWCWDNCVKCPNPDKSIPCTCKQEVNNLLHDIHQDSSIIVASHLNVRMETPLSKIKYEEIQNSNMQVILNAEFLVLKRQESYFFV